MLRFVTGADAAPGIDFQAPDAPSWTRDDSVFQLTDDGAFSLLDAGHCVVQGRASARPLHLEVATGEAEILGFGAASGTVNRNDTRFRVLTRDTLLYGIPGASYTAFPFFIVRRAGGHVGVLVATTYPLDVEASAGRVRISAACDTEGTPLDVLVLRGSLAEIVADLACVVGRSFLPPAWALGYHQSRWSYRNAGTVLDVARRFRALDLPADVIHLDIHYMERYRVFTFHPRRFPAPRAMHEELDSLGFRSLAIVDPGVSVAEYPVHDQLRAGDMLLKRSDGSPYVGKVWPGATVFPDFAQARVRETWGQLHRPLVEAGVAGVWNDMNDPVLKIAEVYEPLDEDVHHGAAPHRRLRNLYANGMAEASAGGLAALNPGRRPFVLSRSGFLGIQRHSAVWTGDNHSSWAHLRENLHMVLNLGLSGVPICGADVGGFARGPGKLGIVKPWRPSAELFVRWMELGALMPFFRGHCTLYAPRQEPWSFGPAALDLSRRILRRRYRLLPLLYRLALESHQTGLPMIRPLAMHYDAARDQGVDQFLLGEHLLVAPVLDRGATRRDVWLPAGLWYDWHSGEPHDGGTCVSVAAPLGTTPMFVRGGTALFVAEPRRNAPETLRAPLALEIYPAAGDSGGRGSLFLDDGESTAERRLVLDAIVATSGQGLCLRFERIVDRFVPAQADLEVRVPAQYRLVTADGEALELQPHSLDAEDRSARIARARLPIGTRVAYFE
jgi:alpha-glucosidase